MCVYLVCENFPSDNILQTIVTFTTTTTFTSPTPIIFAHFIDKMGNPQSKKETTTVNKDVGEVESSSGFHLLEIHAPSVGLSYLFLLALVFGLCALYGCYLKFVKKHRGRALQLQQQPIQQQQRQQLAYPALPSFLDRMGYPQNYPESFPMPQPQVHYVNEGPGHARYISGSRMNHHSSITELPSSPPAGGRRRQRSIEHVHHSPISARPPTRAGSSPPPSGAGAPNASGTQTPHTMMSQT